MLNFIKWLFWYRPNLPLFLPPKKPRPRSKSIVPISHESSGFSIKSASSIPTRALSFHSREPRTKVWEMEKRRRVSVIGFPFSVSRLSLSWFIPEFKSLTVSAAWSLKLIFLGRAYKRPKFHARFGLYISGLFPFKSAVMFAASSACTVNYPNIAS